MKVAKTGFKEIRFSHISSAPRRISSRERSNILTKMLLSTDKKESPIKNEPSPYSVFNSPPRRTRTNTINIKNHEHNRSLSIQGNFKLKSEESPNLRMRKLMLNSSKNKPTGLKRISKSYF